MQLLDQLCDDYMIRYTRKQKTAFLQFLTAFCKDHNWKSSIETNGFANHLIAGDLQTAKIVFTAHYDTPMKSLFPYTLYPASRTRTFWSRYWPILLLLFVFVLLSFLLTYPLFRMMLGAAYLFFLVYLGLRLWIGPANLENWNKNTSGVAVMLLLMQTLNSTNRGKAAFVFLDECAQTLTGCKKLYRVHRNEFAEKNVIDLNCVGKGDVFFVVPGSGNDRFGFRKRLTAGIKKQAAALEKSCVLLPSSRRLQKGTFSVLPCSAGICTVQTAGKFSKGIRYIGTGHDDHWDEKNLHLLVQALRKFVEKT